MSGVAVFSPSPLFTVTIEELASGPCEVHFHAGGQGFWAARMARVLGADAVLCGPFGGESGPVIRRLIQAEGIEVRAVACAGANGGYVHDRRGGERRVLAQMPSPELTRHEVDDLYTAALATGIACGVAVLAGAVRDDMIDADVYRRLALDLEANGVRVVADLSGHALRALEGGVEVLKLSHTEAIGGGLARDASEESLRAAAETLRSRGIPNVIVSRADAPAIALLDGRWLQIRAPRLQPADHRGAGDSMTAGIAAGLSRGLALEDALRLGAAAGAMNVTRHGLATGDVRDIDALLSKVEVLPLAEP